MGRRRGSEIDKEEPAAQGDSECSVKQGENLRVVGAQRNRKQAHSQVQGCQEVK